MAQITLEIPDEIFHSFDSLDEIKKTVYEDFVIEQRQHGKISLGKAAELLGMSYTEFFELLGRKGLPYINASRDELETSHQNFENIFDAARK